MPQYIRAGSGRDGIVRGNGAQLMISSSHEWLWCEHLGLQKDVVGISLGTSPRLQSQIVHSLNGQVHQAQNVQTHTVVPTPPRSPTRSCIDSDIAQAEPCFETLITGLITDRCVREQRRSSKWQLLKAITCRLSEWLTVLKHPTQDIASSSKRQLRR